MILVGSQAHLGRIVQEGETQWDWIPSRSPSAQSVLVKPTLRSSTAFHHGLCIRCTFMDIYGRDCDNFLFFSPTTQFPKPILFSEPTFYPLNPLKYLFRSCNRNDSYSFQPILVKIPQLPGLNIFVTPQIPRILQICSSSSSPEKNIRDFLGSVFAVSHLFRISFPNEVPPYVCAAHVSW